MNTILQSSIIDKLPMAELTTTLEAFLEPVLICLPEKRLQKVGKLAVQGIIGGQSPLVTQMARGVVREEETIWPTAKRLYRFIWNQRFSHRDLLKGLYGIVQRSVGEHAPSHLVVALDPVNFEKPYTEKLEGVSTVMKSTPPGPGGEKRLTPGYPAMTATVVNLPEPVITYANWFSYRTADFVSENREIYRAIRITRALFPNAKLRFVADSGLDDQKIFAQMSLVNAKFVIRARHNRRVEVYNDRLDRWEEELLDDLITTVPLSLKLRVAFTHARRVRVVDREVGWLKIRLPQTLQVLWTLVAHDPISGHDLVFFPICPFIPPPMPERYILNGAIDLRSNIPTVLTKKMAWMSKMCGCRPWSACGGSSCSSCSPLYLCTISPTPGLNLWSCGFAIWVANWASRLTSMAPMFSWLA